MQAEKLLARAEKDSDCPRLFVDSEQDRCAAYFRWSVRGTSVDMRALVRIVRSFFYRALIQTHLEMNTTWNRSAGAIPYRYTGSIGLRLFPRCIGIARIELAGRRIPWSPCNCQ